MRKAVLVKNVGVELKRSKLELDNSYEMDRDRAVRGCKRGGGCSRTQRRGREGGVCKERECRAVCGARREGSVGC